ncbi:MAG TPA: alpha/beta hydrolase-fold protein [Acidimicrobiales bacterium]|jgi:enterochelin esterase family protein
MSGERRVGPVVRSRDVTFRVHDPDGALRSVMLRQELTRPRIGPHFTKPRASDIWRLQVSRPPVDRMEYRLELGYPHGGSETVCDPGNPLVAPGPFGHKSVVEFPEYRAPAWLAAPEPPVGTVTEHHVDSPAIGAGQPVTLWSAAGSRPDDRLPLLVANDGPEYARYSGLLAMLDRMVDAGRLPPMRAALLPPVDRNEHYSASPAYAKALARDVLPAVDDLAPRPRHRSTRVGIGASLGALSMLHVHRSRPTTFGALFLQSGSFFVPHHDGHESWMRRYDRVVRFVARMHAAEPGPDPVPVVMTCGTGEENLANNRDMRGALLSLGYDVALHEVRDAHNWVAWRDAFDPHLVGLLGRMWS